MKKLTLALALILAATAAHAQEAIMDPSADVVESSKAIKTADIVNNKNEKIGTLNVKDGGVGALIQITINAGGLPQGWHAAHFHSVGDCADHDHFHHAKAHISLSGRQHGLLNPDGPEEGDLPNIFIHADGSGAAEFYSNRLRLGSVAGALDDEDGSALIIHTNADDHYNQPIGNAGARLACSIIKR